MINKGGCDREYIWNPSNCECECDKSCDVAKYLDYKNCKSRKKLVDKLVEECTETAKEVKIMKIIINAILAYCTLYNVLFSIFFTISIGIGVYFAYYKYMNHNKENVSKYNYSYQGKNY